MSEFKIRVGVELDASDLESKLKGLDGDHKISIDLELKNFSKIESQLKSLKNSFQDAFKLDTGFISDLKKISDVMDGAIKPSSGKALSSVVKEYKELSNLVAKLQKQMNTGKLGEDSIERTSNQIKDLKKQMSSLYNSMSDSQKASVDLFNTKQATKSLVDMNNYMNKIESQATSLGTKLNSISFKHIDDSKINRITNELEKIQDKAKQDIDLNLNVGDTLSDLNRLSSEIKNLEKVENLASSFDKISGSIKDSTGDIETFTSEIKNLESISGNLDGSFEQAFKKANDELKDMQSNVKKLSSSSSGGIFGTKDDFLGNFSQFKLLDLAGDLIADGARQMMSAWKDTIVETDAAITDLGKVYNGNLTGKYLKNYLTDVSEVAKGTGQTSVDIIQGTTKAIQSGIKDMDDALVFAQQSAIFSNVGDIDQEQADTALTAIMSAYGGVENSLKPVREQIQGMSSDYSTLNKFTDLANHAGNNYAVTTADVGEALQKSASALQTNGVSMQEATAMTVAMNEVLQDASRTGTSLKSISAGLSGVAVSSKDGSIQLTKSGKALKEIAGIDVWNEKTGEIMDMYDVMDQLSEKWGDLSEAEQNALGTAISGKTQLNSFNALLSNWDTARQYMEDYKSGLTIGSAERENERYLDSIAGKWNVIKENMKSIGNTLITSDMAKGFLDGVIGVTDGLGEGLKLTMTLFESSFKGTLDKTFGDGLYKYFDKFQSSNLFDKMFGNWGDEFGKLGTTVSTILGKGLESVFYNTSLGKALKPILSLINIGDKASESGELDDAIDERKGNINSIQSEINALKNQKTSLDEVMESYEELSEKTNRSQKENQQLAQIREQLAQTNPDMILGYDQDGNVILKNAKAYSSELERQIKLKQQSQRLEENALANDAYSRRLEQEKEYSELMEKNNKMKLFSDTNKKEGLFGIGSETTSEYLKRLGEQNEQIEEQNAKTYKESLDAYQQYLEDEKAIQEKHINQMESSNGFKKMADKQKESMLGLMQSLDWSGLSLTEGSAVTKQLEQLGEKVVSTTEEMGEHAKGINVLEESYSNGKKSLMDYTDGLGQMYENANKIDVESLSNWQTEMQSYIDTTGDLAGASKMIDEMATSLERVTKIPKGTWSELLTLDPAPIDASNQALQRFLQTYNTGVDKIGIDVETDNLVSQFETLQTSLQQLTIDGVSGEIDAEYLLNMKVNQPEPIQNLIDEIVKGGVDQETELPVLVNAMIDILNTGEISSDTIEQISEVLDMDVQDVEMMLNVHTEVVGMEDIASEIETWNSLTNDEKQLLLKQVSEGGDEIKISKEEWESLTEEEKIQTLRQALEKEGNIEEANQEFESAKEGEKKATYTTESKENGNIEEVSSKVENAPEGNKEFNYNTNVNENGNIQQASEWAKGAMSGSTNFDYNLSVNDEGVEEASKKVESLPKEHTTKVSIVQSGANLLDSISNWFKSKTNETVSVSVKVTGQEMINSVKTAIDSLSDKNISVNTNINGLSQINQIKTSLSSLQSKTISVNASVNGTAQVNSLKTAITGLQGKTISVTATTSGTAQVNALTSAISKVNAKTVSVTANVSGTSQVNALVSAINRVKSKSVKISASVSGTGAVQSLASAIASVKSKSVRVSATKTVTTINKTVTQSSTPASASTLSNIPVYSTDSSSLTNIPVSASDVSPINVPVSMSANNDFGGTIDKNKILPSLDFDISHIKDLEEALERLGKQLDFLDEKADSVFGQEKVNLLQQQIPLLREQQKIQEQIAKNERAQNNELIYWLSQQGFAFDNLGNISNYNDKLLSMEQNVESLKKKYDNLNDAENKNETAIKNAKNAYESANETLSKTKDYLEEYFTTNNKEITEASEKWWEYENQIREVEEAIRELANAQLEFKIDSVSDSIDFLDAKMENMNSQEKLKYLEEQNDLYREQQQLLHQLAEQMRSQLATLNPLSEEYAELSSEIMKLSTEWWDLQNSISDNLNSIFEEKSTNKLNSTLENLENQIDFLDEKMNHYNGQEKIGYIEEQVKLYREQQNQMHLLANELRYQLTLLDPASEQYQELSSEIIGLSTEWWKVEEAIKDATSEVEELNRQMKLLSVEAELEELDVLFTRLQFELDLIDKKMEYTWGTDKINAMKDSIELLNEQLDLQQEKLGLTNSRFAIYQDSLRKYNFQFDKMGNVTNYSEVLDLYKNSSQLEEIIDLYGEYKDIQEELQEQTLEYWEMDSKIKDLQMEKLEITEEIEEEITKLLEEEYEKRTQDIEDYTDAQIKLLNKEKEAYESLRKQQDYDKSINEQLTEIERLNSLIATASRDTSVSGQKRLAELMEDLTEAQKELEEMTQDKIDEDYSNNIDNEIERLEQQEEDLLKLLEEQFSEENIAKIVAESLTSGFIEINGEVQSLQNFLLNSVDESAQAYSAMSNVIKEELCTNLNVALSTMKEMNDIYQNLGLSDYGAITNDKITIPNIEGNSSVKSVTIGDTVINVSGNVDDETLDKIEQMLKESQEELLQELTKDLY